LYKSLTKSVTKYSSQNCDDRLKLAFFGHCDQMRYLGIAVAGKLDDTDILDLATNTNEDKEDSINLNDSNPSEECKSVKVKRSYQAIVNACEILPVLYK
jgi:hypothetical protein